MLLEADTENLPHPFRQGADSNVVPEKSPSYL
jgi:hypothetical protein